ncbi:glycosyl transferase [Candidatus Tenderia electrophaga]|jgi:mannosyltransferase OCH1-like enzyme|uniref:Glycosyl transferase n=1 Tax=Candidatus Tenderia electrophaga TaxID=1748243 RepID=A0A0S2TAK5_9GAMM|nr:glycosyl transferase [Candidatus Tenderia electrophaga]
MGTQYVKKFLILFVSRIIKIIANLTKLLCYVFHFLFPNKRFTLPQRAAPIFSKRGPAVISRIIWQTNYTDRVTLPLYLNYLFNRLLSPSFEYRFMVTEARADFIQSNYAADIYDNYSKLQIGAAQADFWRLLVLQKYGGVYLDIDAHFVWPLGGIVKPDYDELYVTTKRGDISNYFIASKKDNPHLAQMIDVVLDNIKHRRSENVYDLTGPGVFNQVLDNSKVNTTSYRYTCNQGNFTNEYFQYVDKPEGKWTKAQHKIDIIRK